MSENLPTDAGNGLLGRRTFLRLGTTVFAALAAVPAMPMERAPWMRAPGAPLSKTGAPSPHAEGLERVRINAAPGTTGAGASCTPLERLEGIITPSRLHFERHHAGIPDIHPDEHRLVLHGLVERPLAFDLDALGRYPIESRLRFLECSGNGSAALADEPRQAPLSSMNGLVACSEWGGVPLSILLEEAGLKPGARWIVADGADAPVMSRSVPLEKAMDAMQEKLEPLESFTKSIISLKHQLNSPQSIRTILNEMFSNPKVLVL